MSSLGQILHRIISFRHHYIMKITFDNAMGKTLNSNIILEKIYDQSELIDGTYSVDLQVKLIKNNIGKCETFILREKNKQAPIGVLSVMYRGGNELEYKIRNIEAFIYNVMIDGAFRGKGYVGEMLKMLGVHLKKQGIEDAYLAVSTDNYSAIKAYKKIGFETVFEKRFIRCLKKNIPYYSL